MIFSRCQRTKRVFWNHTETCYCIHNTVRWDTQEKFFSDFRQSSKQHKSYTRVYTILKTHSWGKSAVQLHPLFHTHYQKQEKNLGLTKFTASNSGTKHIMLRLLCHLGNDIDLQLLIFAVYVSYTCIQFIIKTYQLRNNHHVIV